MINVLLHKRKIELLTPFTDRGRAMVAKVEVWGLSLRFKGERRTMDVSWAMIHNRAAQNMAEKAREQRRAK